MELWATTPSLVYRPPISEPRLMSVTLLRTSTCCGPTRRDWRVLKYKIELTFAFHQTFHCFLLPLVFTEFSRRSQASWRISGAMGLKEIGRVARRTSLKHQHRPCNLPLIHIVEGFVQFVQWTVT